MALLMSVKGTLQWQRPHWGFMIAVQKGSWPGYNMALLMSVKVSCSMAEAWLRQTVVS